MSSMYGQFLRLSLFGQSHGEAIGITMDGFPAGMTIDRDELAFELGRRRPGQNGMTTPRREDDNPEFLSGILGDQTTGQPICAIIRNTNQRSSDYGDGVDLVRPSHADYTGHVRYFGYEDWRGGGSFSGRLTAPLVLAGTLCGQYLKSRGMRFESHIRSLGSIMDTPFDMIPEKEDLSELKTMMLPTISADARKRMEECIRQAREDGDSVGGVVECRIVGAEPGLGAPFFDSVESELARLMFSIPGVKGVAFGSGFDLTLMRGSQANDAFAMREGRVTTATNHAGGANGGITNGMPVLFEVAVRPTPSIGKEQATISLKNRQDAKIEIRGRHDPCILPRVTPVVEAMAKIGMMELVKERESCLNGGQR